MSFSYDKSGYFWKSTGKTLWPPWKFSQKSSFIYLKKRYRNNLKWKFFASLNFIVLNTHMHAWLRTLSPRGSFLLKDASVWSLDCQYIQYNKIWHKISLRHKQYFLFEILQIVRKFIIDNFFSTGWSFIMYSYIVIKRAISFIYFR